MNTTGTHIDRVVVDDARTFAFDAPHLRNSADAVAYLHELHAAGGEIGELWLDHDLGGDDTIVAVVDQLCEWAVWDTPLRIGRVWAHSSNPAGAEMIVRTLGRWYPARRIDPLPHLADR